MDRGEQDMEASVVQGLPAADRPCLALAADAPHRNGVTGLVASLLLHALLALVLVVSTPPPEPASAGDDAMLVDIVIAEDAIDIPVLPQPDDPRIAMEDIAPSIAAAEIQPKIERVDIQPDPERPDIADFLLPVSEPEPVRLDAPVAVAASPAEATPPTVTQDESHAGVSDAYRARIARHLARFKRFPPNVRQKLAQGRVVVAFDLSPEGRVIRVAVAQSSGIPAFDLEAQAMVRRAEPFPAPAIPAAAPISFAVPVAYRLRD